MILYHFANKNQRFGILEFFLSFCYVVYYAPRDKLGLMVKETTKFTLNNLRGVAQLVSAHRSGR